MSSPRASRTGARWVAMAVIGVLGVAACYLLLVRTYLGQYLENAALLGAQQAAAANLDEALESLHVISLTSLVAVILAYVAVGIARRSWRVVIAAAGTLGGATVLTEILKRYVLTRPDLAPIYPDNTHNSFPSGHTTIAIGIVVSLILVLSYRMRGWIVIPALTWAVGVGAATVTARWHRLSDTMAAALIVLAVGAIASLWLQRQGAIRRETGRTYRIRAIVLAIVGATGVGALVIGIVLAVASLDRFGVFADIAAASAAGSPLALTAHLDPVFNENMFYAVHSLAYAFSVLCALWFWATYHRLATGRPAATRPVRSSRT